MPIVLLERQIPLFQLVNKIFDADFHFDGHDAARSFFLDLQNEIKNMNFMPFKSERYDKDICSHRRENSIMPIKGHLMKKVYDRIVDMRGNLLTVIAEECQLLENWLASIKQNGESTYASVLRIDGDKVTLQAFENTRGHRNTRSSLFLR